MTVTLRDRLVMIRRVDRRAVMISLAGAAITIASALLSGVRLWMALMAGAAVVATALVAAWRPLGEERVDAGPTSSLVPRRQEEPPFEEILDGLADPILVVTGAEAEDLTSRRFTYANAAARELLLIQRPDGPLTTAVRSPEGLEAADEALFGGVRGEAVYAPGGAQGRIWRARAVPLRRGSGGRRLAILTLRDETEVRRAERTRADFLANASHELRTPLASLAGFIETLRGHAREDVGARDKFLSIMHQQARRMSRLIDDLMSLSRIELNEHVPPAGEVDLGLAVVDALDALGPQAEEGGVTFRVRGPAAGLALILGDRDQVLQVIQNLAENALKYSPRGGEVAVEIVPGLSATVAASPRRGQTAHISLLTPDHALGQSYIALRVQDAGPGLAREHLPRLTERFYRVEGQKSGERGGTGLGLAIVKHIVNRHRGGLCVESAEGEGAAFTAYFPQKEASQAEPPATSRTAPS